MIKREGRGTNVCARASGALDALGDQLISGDECAGVFYSGVHFFFFLGGSSRKWGRVDARFFNYFAVGGCFIFVVWMLFF